MSANELYTKIKEIKELQAMKEELEAEISALTDTVKAVMGDTEELRAGEYKVRWTPVTSSRIDTTALKKAMPDVAEAFTRTSTTRRFSIA